MSNKKIIPAVVAAASMAFGFCQSVHAKSPVPGKPGTQDIVEIAASVNAETCEFDHLLAAAGDGVRHPRLPRDRWAPLLE